MYWYSAAYHCGLIRLNFMEKKTYHHASLSLPYYVRGARPGLLLLSGAHGDEFEVIDSVHAAIDVHQNELPDFLYIPEVSPSSVSGRTRHNCDSLDINRQFVDDTECEEAQAVMALLKDYNIDTCVSFHEDPEQEQFYLYDSGECSAYELARIQEAVKSCGVGLFSGIDDPEDAHLGFEFKDGYRAHVGADGKPVGPIETWLIRNKIATRVFGVEVPGKIPASKKDQVTTCLFECLCLVY